MNDHQPFAWPVVHSVRAHKAMAIRCTIPWPDIDVLGPQAQRTMIAVTAVGQRHHFSTAVLADKALILGSPADGSASRLKKRSSTGAQGSVSLSHGQMCWPLLPGSGGRWTDSPPVSPHQGSAITSASSFTGTSLIPRIRYHDRVYVIAPVTVGQASPAASGRCHPALTGVGAVP